MNPFLAHLDELGVALFAAPPGQGQEFARPKGWQALTQEGNCDRVAQHRPGYALMGVMGGDVAVLDLDVKNGCDLGAVAALLDGIGVRVYAAVATPSGGRHLYVAGHPDLPTVHAASGRDGLTNYPGLEVLSFGTNVFLPGTTRANGGQYEVLMDDLEALADGGDDESAENLAWWVSENRAVKAEAYDTSPPWDGTAPTHREQRYLETVLDNQAGEVARMRPNTGRNQALYTAALKCGSFIAGAGMGEATVRARLTDAARSCGLVDEDGAASVNASIASGIHNGRQNPRAVPPGRDDLLDMVSQPHAALDAATSALDDAVERTIILNQAVQRELDLLRVKEQARRIFDAEQHPATEFAGLYLDGDALDQLPQPEPLIDRVLNRHSYAILSGRDGTYKTFVALDWAWCLATGKPWQGRAVEPVRVLYIAGEGAYGLHVRKQAWEAAWATRVDPATFTVRAAALDLYRGGAVLDELLDRVGSGGYGLVVVDTLRRVSGRADGNSSDMGLVVDNLARIREATDNGTVLALTHTAKDDGDTRGFSGIEDDADIVWHAKKVDTPPMSLDLLNRKMKDGPEGDHLELTMSPSCGSLVVSRHARSGGVILVGDDEFETDAVVIQAMCTAFAKTGATATELKLVTELGHSTFYKARGRLLDAGRLVVVRRGGIDRVYLPDAVDMPVDKDPK